MPLGGHPLQCVQAAIGKPDAGTGDEIFHGARDQHFARPRGRTHPGPYMHRDSADIPVKQLNLSGVKSRSHFQAELPHLISNTAGTAHGPGRSVESRDEAIPDVRHVLPSIRVPTVVMSYRPNTE